MRDDIVDVSDIDPAVLLASLYNGASVMGMGVFQARRGNMTVDQAKKLLSGEEVETDYGGARVRGVMGRSNYFDYLYGKPLKIEINGKTLRTSLYDRDHGNGAAQRIIDSIRGN